MGLDAARNDPLREIARVRLQRLDAPRLQSIDVVVVDRGRLGEDLLLRHHGQQLSVRDPTRPFLPELSPVLAQVFDELVQQRRIDVWRGRLGLRNFFGLHSHLLRSGSARGRAPLRNRLVMARIVSSRPTFGGAAKLLATSAISASTSQDAETSVRKAPAAWPRSNSCRSDSATASSNCRRFGRTRSRASTTKASPTSARARTARVTASSGETSLILADASRLHASAAASSASRASNVSRLGKYR